MLASFPETFNSGNKQYPLAIYHTHPLRYSHLYSLLRIPPHRRISSPAISTRAISRSFFLQGRNDCILPWLGILRVCYCLNPSIPWHPFKIYSNSLCLDSLIPMEVTTAFLFSLPFSICPFETYLYPKLISCKVVVLWYACCGMLGALWYVGCWRKHGSGPLKYKEGRDVVLPYYHQLEACIGGNCSHSCTTNCLAPLAKVINDRFVLLR